MKTDLQSKTSQLLDEESNDCGAFLKHFTIANLFLIYLTSQPILSA